MNEIWDIVPLGTFLMIAFFAFRGILRLRAATPRFKMKCIKINKITQQIDVVIKSKGRLITLPDRWLHETEPRIAMTITHNNYYTSSYIDINLLLIDRRIKPGTILPYPIQLRRNERLKLVFRLLGDYEGTGTKIDFTIHYYDSDGQNFTQSIVGHPWGKIQITPQVKA